MNFNTVFFIITVFILVVMLADIRSNQLISEKKKKDLKAVCAVIFAAGFCEWIGNITNGAAEHFILLQRLAKLAEFSISPLIAFAVANAYGKINAKKIALPVFFLHAAFEIVASFYNLVFSIDSNNIYHREKLFWVYIAVFSVSIIFSFASVFAGSREYQTVLAPVLIAIMGFIAFGILIQMIYKEIRISYMCISIGNVMLYNYQGNIRNFIDVTTKLMNRRCYERKIKNMESPSFVLNFDVNKFKMINDTYGHAKGDECLLSIAKVIYDIYAKFGHCYRIGGDEFCVILYKNLDNLDMLNKEFNKRISELKDIHDGIVGVSLGYAYYDKSNTEIEAAIAAADEMMYRKKSNAKQVL